MALSKRRFAGRARDRSRPGRFLRSMPKPGRRVALRVEIEDQHLLADGRQRRAEIDGRRGLADAALLVGKHQNARLGPSALLLRDPLRSVIMIGSRWRLCGESWPRNRSGLAGSPSRISTISRASVNSASDVPPLGKQADCPRFQQGLGPFQQLGQRAPARGPRPHRPCRRSRE